MLLPIGSDIQHKRHPNVTYGIICLNLIVFALQWSSFRAGGLESSNEFAKTISAVLNQGKLSSANFHILSLFTYQFLHASWWHILGNMIFLLPFGKAVEDRMGHVGFAFFYIVCGAIGGWIHTLFSDSPVVGASGSVCAVTAAFIVLAPKTRIHVLLVFFVIGIFKIPSLLFVLFFVLFDALSLLANISGANAGNTAWVVHLMGYTSGFVFTFILLSLRIIKSTQFDLTEVFKQARRRHTYHKAIAGKPAIATSSVSPTYPVELTLSSIAQSVASGNTLAGADQYLRALDTNSNLLLDQRTHVQIGNALIKAGRIEEGVKVHEKYLEQQPNAKNRGEIALLLAAKYTRQLHNSKRARELLNDFAADFSEQHDSLVITLSNELNT